MRIRFTIDDARWSRVQEYAEATNRTTSELICEALDQIQARYPKRRHAAETELDVLASKVAAILRLQVPAGTFGGK
jgi:predicted transcriptional regulator